MFVIIALLLISCRKEGVEGQSQQKQEGFLVDTSEEEASLSDRDQDGVKASDDCDDYDPRSTIISEDADCDGVVTEEDCNDEDPEVRSIELDQDCDLHPP